MEHTTERSPNGQRGFRVQAPLVISATDFLNSSVLHDAQIKILGNVLYLC